MTDSDENAIELAKNRAKEGVDYTDEGHFELLNDEVLRPKYLMGMATFANDKDRLLRLRLYLKSVEEDIKGLEERMDKVSNRLKHPFDD